LKHEIIWKPLAVTLYRLVQNFDPNAIQNSEIKIEKNLLTTKIENSSRDLLNWDDLLRHSR
jgi:hypothetical protein